MTGRRPVPRRHWRSYGDAPRPTGAEALNEPFAAFPSWFMRITCDRAGRTGWSARRTRRSAACRSVPSWTRCAMTACGGRAGRVELLTGASSRPVRRIVLIAG
jgi:hypothetical protein